MILQEYEANGETLNSHFSASLLLPFYFRNFKFNDKIYNIFVVCEI